MFEKTDLAAQRLAFSQDGKYMICATNDAIVKLNLRTGATTRLATDDYPTSLLFSSSAGSKIVFAKKSLFQVDATSNSITKLFSLPQGHEPMWIPAVDPQVKTAVVYCDLHRTNQSVEIWDIEKRSLIVRVPETSYYEPPNFAFSPDGSELCIAYADHVEVRSRRFQRSQKLLDSERPIFVQFSLDGAKLFVITSTGVCIIVDAKTKKEMTRVSGVSTTPLSTLAENPIRLYQIYGHLAVFDVAKKTEIGRLEIPESFRSCLAVSQDGKYLAVGGKGVRVYGVRN